VSVVCGDGEGGALGVLVLFEHLWQLEVLQTLALHGYAYYPTCIANLSRMDQTRLGVFALPAVSFKDGTNCHVASQVQTIHNFRKNSRMKEEPLTIIVTTYHECDRFLCRKLRGKYQIPFVLPGFVVNNHYVLPSLYGFDCCYH
jgi:hypothetical protein